MADEHATLTLTLTDEMSAGLQSIAQHLDGLQRKMKETGEQGQEAFKRVGQRAGQEMPDNLKRVEDAAKKMGESIRHTLIDTSREMGNLAGATLGMERAIGTAAATATRFGLSLAGVAGTSALTVTGIAALGFGVYKLAEHLTMAYQKGENFRRELGELSDVNINAWRAAGRSIGIAQDQMDNFMQSMAAQIKELPRGEFSKIFQDLSEHGQRGIEMWRRMRDAEARGVEPLEILAEHLKEVHGLSERFQRERAAEMGITFAQLNRMTEALERWQRIYRRPDVIAAQKESEKAMKGLAEQTEQFEIALMKFYPTWLKIQGGVYSGLTAILNQMTAIANMDWFPKEPKNWDEWKDFLFGPRGPQNPLRPGSPAEDALRDYGRRRQQQMEGRQHGGPVTQGQSYLVGEAGPEVFTPRTGGNVLAMAAGGSSGMLKEISSDEKEGNSYLKEMRDTLQWMREAMEEGEGAGAGTWGAGRGGAGAGGGMGALPGFRRGTPRYGGGGNADGTSYNPQGAPDSNPFAGPMAGAEALPPGGVGGGGGIGGGPQGWMGTVFPEVGGGRGYLPGATQTPPGWGPGGSGQPWGTTQGASTTGDEAGGGNAYLVQRRAKLFEELKNNPRLQKEIEGVLAHETHGNLTGSTGVMETMVNRALRKGTTLSQEIHSGFYGPVNRGEYMRGLDAGTAEVARRSIDAVRGGSNITNFRDDQGTNRFGQPEVPRGGSGVTKMGGEFFYYSGAEARAFAEQEQRRMGAPTGAAPASGGPGAMAPAPAAGAGAVIQEQGRVAAIRRGAIQEQLRQQLQYAGVQTGLEAVITSGGQPAFGPHRTGSHRHDEGGAADLKLRDPVTGKFLDMNNADDARRMAAFTSAAVSAGATGVGAGLGYMGAQTIHIGGGKPASWGGAPWIEAARRAGLERSVDTRSAMAASAARGVENLEGTKMWGGSGQHQVGVDDSAVMKSIAGQHGGNIGKAQVDVNFSNVPKNAKVSANGDGAFEDIRITQTRQMNSTGEGNKSANDYSEE